MTVHSVQMANTVTVVSFKVSATQVTGVTLVQLPSVTHQRSVRLVTIAQRVLIFQSDAQRLFTSQELAPLMFHTANHVKQATTALIMTVFLEFVQRATSVEKRPKSLFHASRAPTIHTRGWTLKMTVLHAQLALPVT